MARFKKYIGGTLLIASALLFIVLGVNLVSGGITWTVLGATGNKVLGWGVILKGVIDGIGALGISLIK